LSTVTSQKSLGHDEAEWPRRRTRPHTSTCRIPWGPVRVNKACCSMSVRAPLTAALWARSIAAATAGAATAHSVDTDFNGDNVKSKPAGCLPCGPTVGPTWT
jgi:hypothetical protein